MKGIYQKLSQSEFITCGKHSIRIFVYINVSYTQLRVLCTYTYVLTRESLVTASGMQSLNPKELI